MAWYKQFENNEKVLVEQNIFNNNELESYQSTYEINGKTKTAVLYYYEDDGKRFYSLGLLENLNTDSVTIIDCDLSEIFKYKTAKTRRKYLYEVIKKNELQYQ